VIDVIRLGKLLAALYSPNEGERSAAAGKLYAWMITNHVHPDDVVVDVKGERDARFDRLMKRFEDENDTLRKENAFYVEHADPKLRSKAQRAGLIENRWDEFATLICERLHVDKLPSQGWRESVLKAIDISKSQLQNWQLGVARIPESAFVKLRATPSLTLTPRKIRKGKSPSLQTNSQHQATLPV
jgi:hypothetical protein